MKNKHFLNTLNEINIALTSKLQDKNLTPEEFAFILGNLNFSAFLLTSLGTHHKICGKLNLNYTQIKKDFEEARAVAPIMCGVLTGQIKLEELFPEIFNKNTKKE